MHGASLGTCRLYQTDFYLRIGICKEFAKESVKIAMKYQTFSTKLANLRNVPFFSPPLANNESNLTSLVELSDNRDFRIFAKTYI